MLNDVKLVGRLGEDPKIITFQNGDKAVEFTLATDQKWRDKNTGERRSKTTWHRVKCYRGLAGVAEQYLRKGSLILAQGMYLNDTYTDREGVKRRSFWLRMDDMIMLDSRSGSSTSPDHTAKTFDPAPSTTTDATADDGSDDLPF